MRASGQFRDGVLPETQSSDESGSHNGSLSYLDGTANEQPGCERQISSSTDGGMGRYRDSPILEERPTEGIDSSSVANISPFATSLPATGVPRKIHQWFCAPKNRWRPLLAFAILLAGVCTLGLGTAMGRNAARRNNSHRGGGSHGNPSPSSPTTKTEDPSSPGGSPTGTISPTMSPAPSIYTTDAPTLYPWQNLIVFEGVWANDRLGDAVAMSRDGSMVAYTSPGAKTIEMKHSNGTHAKTLWEAGVDALRLSSNGSFLIAAKQNTLFVYDYVSIWDWDRTFIVSPSVLAEAATEAAVLSSSALSELSGSFTGSHNNTDPYSSAAPALQPPPVVYTQASAGSGPSVMDLDSNGDLPVVVVGSILQASPTQSSAEIRYEACVAVFERSSSWIRKGHAIQAVLPSKDYHLQVRVSKNGNMVALAGYQRDQGGRGGYNGGPKEDEGPPADFVHVFVHEADSGSYSIRHEFIREKVTLLGMDMVSGLNDNVVLAIGHSSVIESFDIHNHNGTVARVRPNITATFSTEVTGLGLDSHLVLSGDGRLVMAFWLSVVRASVMGHTYRFVGGHTGHSDGKHDRAASYKEEETTLFQAPHSTFDPDSPLSVAINDGGTMVCIGTPLTNSESLKAKGSVMIVDRRPSV